jgi:hypothetical protein
MTDEKVPQVGHASTSQIKSEPIALAEHLQKQEQQDQVGTIAPTWHTATPVRRPLFRN